MDFLWGSIQKIPQKVDFSTNKQKVGFYSRKTPKYDFSHYLVIQEWGCNQVDMVLNNVLNGACQTMSWQNPQYPDFCKQYLI